MAESTPNLEYIKKYKTLLDESLLNTPKPQATSTVDNRKCRYLSADMSYNELETNFDKTSCSEKAGNKEDNGNTSNQGAYKFLLDERDLIGSLKKELDKAMDDIKRESLSKKSEATSLSSLGILKMEDVEDIVEDDTSAVLNNLMPNKPDDCEMSWRMMRELGRQSTLSNRASISKRDVSRYLPRFSTSTGINKPLASTDASKHTSKLNISNRSLAQFETFSETMKNSSVDRERSHKVLHQNPFDGETCSAISLSNEEFASVEAAEARMLQDEASWRRDKGELPIEFDEKSLSGIYPDDRLSGISSYFRQGSCPLGDLGGVDSQTRPDFGSVMFSPIKESKNRNLSSLSSSNVSINEGLIKIGKTDRLNDNFLEDLPTKDLSSISADKNEPRRTVVLSKNNNQADSRSTILLRKDDNQMDKTGRQLPSADLSRISVNDDRLSVSSVASITHIAEILNDMSINASPRLIIDKMLSAKPNRDKTCNNKNNTDSYQNNLFEINKINHNQDLINKQRTLLDQNDESNGVNVDNKSKNPTIVKQNPNVASNIIDGKENMADSLITKPSSESKVTTNKDDSSIFKVPDITKLPKYKKTISSAVVNNDSRNVSILSDTTNKPFDIPADKNILKKNKPKVIDAETNKTLYGEEYLEKALEYINSQTSKGSVSGAETLTRYSSSNASSIDRVLRGYNADNLKTDRSTFDFTDRRYQSFGSSLDELNFAHQTDHRSLEAANETSVSKSSLSRNLDDSVICLSTDVSVLNSDLSTTGCCDNGNNGTKVCVGAIQNCLIPFNEIAPAIKENLSGSLSVKAIKSDGITISEGEYNNIIRLYYPQVIKLEPNMENDGKNIEVLVVPLVASLIEVCLQLKITPLSSDCENKLEEVINCYLKIKGEEAKVKIEATTLTETFYDGINFGVLPEEALVKSFIKLHNVGNVRVPILLEISKLSSDLYIFYLLNEDNESTIDRKGKNDGGETLNKLIILDPGDIKEEPVFCFTPCLPKSNVSKMGQVTGYLTAKIAVADKNISLSPLAEFNLSALVGQTRILIAGHCNPLIVPAFESKPLVIRNAGVIPVKLKLHCDNPSFSIMENGPISLEPEQNGTVDVKFILERSADYSQSDIWKGTLWLSIVTSEIRYSVNLQGQPPLQKRTESRRSNSSDSTNSSDSNHTAPTTRPTSSCSNFSQSTNGGDKEPLNLACNCSALVWSSCPLLHNHTLTKKSCVLRNKLSQREKLQLSINDESSCFKIVEDNGALVSETRMTLEAMESRQITVSFSPTQIGPCKGTLIIRRIQRRSVDILPAPSDKKVLHLYAYGGKSILNIKGIFRDPDSKMWTYLDSNTLRTSFQLENTGDGTAFVRLGQEVAATGVTIKPEECLIAAHKSADVELVFSPTAGRADHILGLANEVLNITRITITHGDEATRLRLKRLYARILKDKLPADSLLMEKLSILNNLFPGSSANEVSILKDKLDAVKTLWMEGVKENIVGVLLERSALENAQLDSTAQFVDLATTIMDETLCTSKLQQLIVAPRVVTLSQSQSISSFSLRNTTVLQTRFHVEIPQPSFGLVVEPVSGILPPHASCLLTVKYIPSGSTLNDSIESFSLCSSIVKIHSDLMDVIEVPINYNITY